MIIRIFAFNLILLFSVSSFACGTPDNWMDAYEGIDSGNNWRDSMSQLEKLVMLRSCGGPSLLNATQQTRMLKVLTDAMNHRNGYSMLRTVNQDIRRSVINYRWRIPFEGLIESTFRRFNCLPDAIKDPALKVRYRGVTLHEYFGSNFCPSGKQTFFQLSADGGANLRSSPQGKIIGSLKDGIKLKIIGRRDHWYRVINPLVNDQQNSMVGYVHGSVVKNIN